MSCALGDERNFIDTVKTCCHHLSRILLCAARDGHWCDLARELSQLLYIFNLMCTSSRTEHCGRKYAGPSTKRCKYWWVLLSSWATLSLPNSASGPTGRWKRGIRVQGGWAQETLSHWVELYWSIGAGVHQFFSRFILIWICKVSDKTYSHRLQAQQDNCLLLHVDCQPVTVTSPCFCEFVVDQPKGTCSLMCIYIYI